MNNERKSKKIVKKIMYKQNINMNKERKSKK